MSSDFVPKAFRELDGKTTLGSIDKAAEALMDETNKVFGELGVEAKVKVERAPKPKAGFCPGCGKEVSGRVLMALDAKWHPDCFVCSQCAGPFGSDSFVVRNGEPWCDKCVKWSDGKMIPEEAAKKPAAKGAGAGAAAPKPAAGKSTTTVSGGGKKAGDFDPMQGFDASDSKSCDVCGNSILTGVDFGGKSFCIGCFKCDSCKQIIEPGEGFLPIGTKFYCKKCAEKAAKGTAAVEEPKGRILATVTCKGCGEAIVGPYVKADGDNYHQDCLVCADCRGSLATGYAMRGSKRVCGDCITKKPKVDYVSTKMDEPIKGIRVDPATGKKTTVEPKAPADPARPAAPAPATKPAPAPAPAPAPKPAAAAPVAAAKPAPAPVAAASKPAPAAAGGGKVKYQFCPECGNLASGDRFCGECGTDLTV